MKFRLIIFSMFSFSVSTLSQVTVPGEELKPSIEALTEMLAASQEIIDNLVDDERIYAVNKVKAVEYLRTEIHRNSSYYPQFEIYELTLIVMINQTGSPLKITTSCKLRIMHNPKIMEYPTFKKYSQYVINFRTNELEPCTF